MNNLWKPIFITTMAAFLAACPAKMETNKPQVVNVYMGNPDSVYAGSETNSKINADVILKSKKIQWHSLMAFSSKASYQKGVKPSMKSRTNRSIEGGSFPARMAESNLTSFTAKIENNTKNLVIENQDSSMQFIFVRDASQNWILDDLTSISSKNSSTKKTDKLSLVHFSLSDDERFFSLLIRTEDLKKPKEITLMSLYFQIDPIGQGSNLSWANSRYKYVDDNARWEKRNGLTLNLCGREAREIQDEIKKSASMWSTALQGKLNFQLDTPKKWPPFSDLNSSCILAIDGYLGHAHPYYQNFGVTMNVADQEKSEFIDGDIFILKGEFNKNHSSFESYDHADNRLFTFLHEMGHLLGLDHQFDGTKSIMSYDFDIEKKLYPYDLEAIEYLYK